MNIKIRLSPPMMPNFISVIPPSASPRQDGFKLMQLSVADLSQQEAEEYAELMKQTFLNHWQQKKAQIQP